MNWEGGFILPPSSFQGMNMKEEVLTRIPDLKARLAAVRSYL